MSRPRIDVDRLLDRLAALAEIGSIDGTEGCARLALTDEDRRGRDLVVSWMRDLDLEVTVDGVGNVIGRMTDAGDAAPVMTGSHIDTVRTGGRYDGNLGVLAGLEVIETLRGAGVTPARPLAVASVFDGEGGFAGLASPQSIVTFTHGHRTYILVVGFLDEGARAESTEMATRTTRDNYQVDDMR